jgi:hypothetical protein
MKHALTIFAAMLLAAVPSTAQQGNNTGNDEDERITDEENPKRPFWEASIPGGHFQVALSKIVSVSLHEYVLDGSVIVTEMTVDTVGQALPRFYYIEPVSNRTSGTGTGDAISAIVGRSRELLERAGQRAGTDVQDMVHKKYGVSTHTKTLEYRLYDTTELSALYNSVRRAWETGRGRKISIR